MKLQKLPFNNWDFFRQQSEDVAVHEALSGQRQAYMQAIEKIMDKSAEAFDEQVIAQMPVQDIALVAVFLASVKMVELSGHRATRKNVLGAANFLIHRVSEEFPDMAKHLGD